MKISLTRNEQFFYSWCSGIGLFLLGIYMFSWIGIGWIYFVVVLLLTVWYIHTKAYRYIFSFHTVDVTTFFLLLFGTVAFFLMTAFSGLMTRNGLQYIGISSADGIVHLAHIKDMLFHFPPMHPGLSGVPFRGYHYFYDFLVSSYSRYLFFSPDDLYFRFFPLLISALYGSAFIVFCSQISKRILTTQIVLLFIYFGQSFSFLLYVINHKADLINGGGMVQGLQLTSDPSVLLSMALLLAVLALLPKVHQSFRYAIVAGLLLGVIMQIKVYVGIAGCGTICLYTLYNAIRYRSVKLYSEYLLVALTAALSSITFLPNNLGAASLLYYPFLFYSHYIQQSVFLPLHWELKRQEYALHNNLKHIIVLYAEAVSIFWIVNLGWMLSIFLKTRSLFTMKFWREDYRVILVSATLIPLFIGTFFVQSISVFDSIQFYWVTYILLSIPTALVISNFLHKKSRILTATVLIFIIGSFLPGLASSIQANVFAADKLIISTSDSVVYKNMTEVIPPDSFYSLLPVKSSGSDSYLFSHIPLSSAMTGRATYYEGEIIDYNLRETPIRQERLITLAKAFAGCDMQKIQQMTRVIGSRYILSRVKIPCIANNNAVLQRSEGITANVYVLK